LSPTAYGSAKATAGSALISSTHDHGKLPGEVSRWNTLLSTICNWLPRAPSTASKALAPEVNAARLCAWIENSAITRPLASAKLKAVIQVDTACCARLRRTISSVPKRAELNSDRLQGAPKPRG
jgi:hypothetical protein